MIQHTSKITHAAQFDSQPGPMRPKKVTDTSFNGQKKVTDTGFDGQKGD
jgi:hypothetical protein